MTTRTGASPLTMRDVNGRYFMRLRDSQQASMHQRIASVFPTNQPQEEYPWLAEDLKLVKWEGERTVQRIKGESIVIVTDEYEATREFKKRDFIRDKTGQVMARVDDMAQTVAVFPTQLLTELIVANGTAYDGVSFFSGSHAPASGITNDNTLASGELQGGATPTVAQQAENVLAVLERMLGFRNAGGQPINEAATAFEIVVPPSLFGKTVGAVNSQFLTAGYSNPIKELGLQMRVSLNARLTGTDWFMFRTDAPIRPFIVQEEDTVPVELGVDSEHCKKTNRVLFGHGWSGGVGYGRYELACRAVPA